jgi:transposase-like protein
MDIVEIQRILDDLDVQLASGRIDLVTYQALTSKWSSRLGLTAPQTSDSASTAPLPLTAIKIACPNCGAPPAEEYSPNRSSYTCPYCSFQFTFERAQRVTNKLKKELEGWLVQMLSGVSVGTAVDASSRAFIFKEKLYPHLEVEFNRSLEALENLRELPMFSLEPAPLFKDYAPAANFLRQNRELLGPVLTLSSKLSAPAVWEFVVSPEDKRRVTQMQGRVSELIHISNLVEQCSRFDAEGYATAGENVSILKQLYGTASAAATDEAEKLFLQACVVRLEAVANVVDTLKRVYSSSGEFMGSNFAGELGAPAKLYEEALQLADQSAYSPMETIPWRHGVEKEMALLELKCTLLMSYDKAAANQNVNNFEYQRALLEFTKQSQAPVTGPKSLGSIVECLMSALEAKRGARGLARVADWSWLNPAVEANRRKKVLLVGVNEEIESSEQYWQPFWLATLSFSQSEGVIFKSGASKHAYLLIDATSGKQSFASFIDETSPLNGQITTALTFESVDGRIALPPILTRAAAQKALEGYAKTNPTLRNPKINVEKIVYLPGAIVTYSSKEGPRAQTFAATSVYNPDTQRLRQSTAAFLRSYSR